MILCLIIFLFLLSRRDILEKAQQYWDIETPATVGAATESQLADTNSLRQSAEVKRRHALETQESNLQIVQELERRLNIDPRWTPLCQDWARVKKMVTLQRYQKALDSLEGLIVARIFELTKMNMSQTGKYFQLEFEQF